MEHVAVVALRALRDVMERPDLHLAAFSEVEEGTCTIHNSPFISSSLSQQTSSNCKTSLTNRGHAPDVVVDLLDLRSLTLILMELSAMRARDLSVRAAIDLPALLQEQAG